MRGLRASRLGVRPLGLGAQLMRRIAGACGAFRSAGRRAWRLVVVGVALLAFAGCSPVGKPSASVSPSMKMSTKGTRDAFSMRAPQGWVELASPPLPWLFAATRTGQFNIKAAGIQVQWTPFKLARDRAGTSQASAKRYRDQSVVDARRLERIVSSYRIKDRMIAGERGYGSATVFSEPGGNQTTYEWMVLRRDGLWEFYVTSDPGGRIPDDLVKALDTVKWETT